MTRIKSFPQEKRETLPEDVTEADFNAYVSAANHVISTYDLEIRSTYHQTSRTRVYALVNSTSDPITQLATSHSADEISFLKRVLDAMFETNNTPRREVMAVTSMQATHLAKPPAEQRGETQNGSATQGSGGAGITLSQAERMMNVMVEEGWFEKSRKGYFSLSPRALMELRGWLMETYNDVGDDEEEDDGPRVLKVKQCYACKEIITVVSVLGAACCEGMLIPLGRANAARSGAVSVDYTIFVPRTSSGCRSPKGVRYARRIGPGMILLAKEQLRLLPNLRDEAERVPMGGQPRGKRLHPARVRMQKKRGVREEGKHNTRTAARMAEDSPILTIRIV